MMKINRLFMLGVFSLALFTGCKEETTEAAITASKGNADFSTYVALGNSLTSGYRDGTLYLDGQKESYPALIAEQMAYAGGGQFGQPLVNDNNGGLTLSGTAILPTRLYIKGFGADGTPNITNVQGAPTTDVTVKYTGAINNFGIPGAKSFHLALPGYGNIQGLTAKTANPYYVRIASSNTSTVLADAMAKNPTFFSLWIGNNDVLGYATSGGDDSDPITTEALFQTSYTNLVNVLTANGAKGVVANIPYVTSIPFFTTVAYNVLTTNKFATQSATAEANIAQLNAQLYGPLKQVLTALGQPNRINLLSTTDRNPLLIKDETLPNLSSRIAAALTPQFGQNVATALGEIYGQARQATSNDLILLSTSSVIGTTKSDVAAPFNTYGITYPLEDKHVLIPSEILAVRTATDKYNVIIRSAATAKGLAFVDANALTNQLASNEGIVYGSNKYTTSFIVGGAFSLDGVHLTGRGYAIVANEFIKAINSTYQSTLPLVDVNKHSVAISLN